MDQKYFNKCINASHQRYVTAKYKMDPSSNVKCLLRALGVPSHFREYRHQAAVANWDIRIKRVVFVREWWSVTTAIEMQCIYVQAHKVYRCVMKQTCNIRCNNTNTKGASASQHKQYPAHEGLTFPQCILWICMQCSKFITSCAAITHNACHVTRELTRHYGFNLR